MYIDRDKLMEFNELVEDAVQYFCDENIVSGELAWILVEVLATAKIADLKGQLARA